MLSFMKRFRAIAALPLLLSACSASPETVFVTATAIVDPDSGEVVTTVMDKPVAPSAVDWQSEYAAVLDTAETYNFDVANPAGIEMEYLPNGDYNYALVEATGGGAPELLLSQWSADEHSNRFARVLVFSVDSGSLTQASNGLTYGAAGAGGYRAGVDASQLGLGLYQSQWTSGTGDGESVWCQLEGNTLVPEGEANKINAMSPPALHLVVDWTPVADRGPLDAGELTVSLPEIERRNPVEGPAEVISGTVVMKTAAELEPEGTPNGEAMDSEYYMLEIDAPREFTDYNRPEPSTRTAEYVDLGRREWSRYDHIVGTEWAPLVGKQVTITVEPSDVWFQTDASMPMGALRVNRYNNVEIHG